MGKVVRIGSRGTSRRVIDKPQDRWTGKAYKEYQDNKKEASKDRYISTGRGTKTVKFSDIATTSGRPSGKGMWISGGRGTRRRKLE